MKKIIGLIAIAAALTFLACGDTVTRIEEVSETSILVVKKGADFPTCDSASNGVMYYSEDSLAVYYCANKKWLPVKGADGKDGKKGEDGTSCTVEKTKSGDFEVFCGDSLMGVLANPETEIQCKAESIENGYKIVCGGDSVAVVLNGKKGDKGEEGAKGDKGNDCTIEQTENGYDVFCGDEKVGTLANGKDGEDGKDGSDGDDCSLKDNLDGTITQICGQDTVTIYKALCGTTPYDPAGSQFCYGIKLYDKCNGEAYDVKTTTCSSAE